MKRVFTVLLASLCTTACFGRLLPNWSYDLLARKADLIIVATPVAVRDTAPKTEFPKLAGTRLDRDRTRVPAIWIETTFERLAVLKGDDPGPQLVLHHLRWPDNSGLISDGPQFVSFETIQKKTYLLFLKKEGDRWVPLTGQVDPVYAIKDLREVRWPATGFDPPQALPASRRAP